MIRLTVEDPVQRTISVVGPDDRPMAGLRLVPRSLKRGNSSFPIQIPDELLERLTVTTDAMGEATLVYLSQAMEPLTVQIAGAGIAAHTLPLFDRPLKMGRTGRLVGVVRAESGQPLAGFPVAVWVRPTGTLPWGLLDASPPETIKFDSPPLTGAEGAFQTPPSLLDGSTYRVSIRQDGFAPFVSEWVTLVGDRTALRPIRLRAPPEAVRPGTRSPGPAGWRRASPCPLGVLPV